MRRFTLLAVVAALLAGCGSKPADVASSTTATPAPAATDSAQTSSSTARETKTVVLTVTGMT